MMFLTVFLNILAISAAIRVPTAWPELEKQIPNVAPQNVPDTFKIPSNQRTKAQDYKIHTKGFYSPKLKHQATDVANLAYFVQHKERPSGSYVEFATNNKKSQNLKDKHSGRVPVIHYPNDRPPTALLANNILINKNNKQNIDRSQDNFNKQPNYLEKYSFSQPNFPTADGWIPIIVQDNPRKIQHTNHVHHPNLNRKHNQERIANQRHPPQRRQYENAQDKQDTYPPSNTHPTDASNYRITRKNSENINESANDEEEEINNENEELENDDVTLKDINEEPVPLSEREIPRKIPTKPNYPGEGQWAILGKKHKPYTNFDTFGKLNQENDDKPEGFQTFEKVIPIFEKQYNKFDEKIESFPQKHALGQYINDKSEEIEDQSSHENEETSESNQEQNAEEDEGEEAEEGEFVPTRTLAQVRKTETEENLPSSLLDSRLREVIKDSKIHTVYTEEGYEDIGYDHAGHEKEAEDSEGHAEFDKDALKTKQKIPKRPKSVEVDVLKEFENYEDPTENQNQSDYESSASSYNEPNTTNKNNSMQMNQFTRTKENKTTEIKDINDENIEMEITSEIKIMTHPNNVSKAHKFVKIIPKLKDKVSLSDDNSTALNKKPTEAIKRRKRYINDFPKIEVEKDFLDVLNADKKQTLPQITTVKYPYYHIKDSRILNKDSPLRYAEDMKNIPIKIPGKMSFYEQSQASECPEIPRNIDPIPDRVQQAQNKHKESSENQKSGRVAELPNVPRLRNLGDKIDCLKMKLFGENPLDSPIFQEEVIGPPDSIFKEFDVLNTVARTENYKDKQQLDEAKYISRSLAEQAADRVQEDDYEEEAEPISDIQEAENSFDEDDLEEQSQEQHYPSDVNEEYEDTNSEYQYQIDNKDVQTSTEEATNHNYQNTANKIFTTPPYVDNTPEPPTVSTTESTTNTKNTNKYLPRHIYDQIDSSEKPVIINNYVTLPNPSTKSLRKKVVSEAPIQNQIIQTTESYISSTVMSSFAPKHIYDQIDHEKITKAVQDDNNLNSTFRDGEAQKPIKTDKPIAAANVNNRQPKDLNTVTAPDLTQHLAKVNLTDSQSLNIKRMGQEESLPESAALQVNRRRRKRPQRPLAHIFDINGYLPTPLPALNIYPTGSTVLPKYRTISEVFYKDDIKPNEQLNVFADVINNIKNSPPETIHAECPECRPIIENSIKNSAKKLKVPPRKTRIKHSDATKAFYDLSNTYYITSSTTTSTTTIAPTRRRRKNKYKNHKPEVTQEYFESLKENGKDQQSASSIKVHRKVRSTTSKPDGPYILEDSSNYIPNLKQNVASGTVVEDVLGLSPPFSEDFSEIDPAPTDNVRTSVLRLSESTPLNTFPVVGMKPPNRRKPLLYSKFRLGPHNRFRRRNSLHRIHKRSPIKPSYSEIKRNNPAEHAEKDEQKIKEVEETEEEEEEEDDYVPNRNRNFHYDIENNRVVYTNQKKEVEEEIVEDPELENDTEEEEEEGVEYLTLERVTPAPKFVVITTERNGPSFLEYFHQLRNNSKYIEIPEPTEKPVNKTKLDLKEVESTTTNQIEKVIPEFLNIVSKLKTESDYKEIRDKKEKPSTTPAVSDELEEEEEDEDENIEEVINSPGGNRRSGGYDRSQIFDITGYLPDPQDYSPKTVIDYSKYKTIQRAPVATRHNISSRYNSENDDLSENNPDSSIDEDNINASSYEKEIADGSHSRGSTRRNGYSSSREVEEEEQEEEKAKEEVVIETTTKTPVTTTTKPRKVITRGRKRPTTTTPKPTVTVITPAPSITRRQRLRSRPTTRTTTTTVPQRAENDSHATRRSRSRYRTTTEPGLEENYSQIQRVVHRRIPIVRRSKHNQTIPPNHKAFYTPLVIEEQTHSDPKLSVKRKISGLDSPEQPLTLATDQDSNFSKNDEKQLEKLPEVQVFKQVNLNQKHGGNYRKEHEDSSPQGAQINSVPPTAYDIENSKELGRLSDVVPKPFAFYSDPKLPDNINQLKEPKVVVDVPDQSEESENSSGVGEKSEKVDQEYDEPLRIHFNKDSETATKKPVYIVKDPSKRLYFYAPVK